MITYSLSCRHCGYKKTLSLDPEKVDRWRHGELIQNVFPELGPADRELMISRTCDDCFKRLFSGDDGW